MLFSAGKTIEVVFQLQRILSFLKTPVLSFCTFSLHFNTLLSDGVLLNSFSSLSVSLGGHTLEGDHIHMLLEII